MKKPKPGFQFCNVCRHEKEIDLDFNKGTKTCKTCLCMDRKLKRLKMQANGESKFAYATVTKIEVLKYKGNSCLICGYNKYSGALDLHHRFPEKKSPRRKKGHGGWHLQRDIEELNLCILVCSNCHREIHAGLHDDRLDVLLALQKKKHEVYLEEKERIRLQIIVDTERRIAESKKPKPPEEVVNDLNLDMS